MTRSYQYVTIALLHDSFIITRELCYSVAGSCRRLQVRKAIRALEKRKYWGVVVLDSTQAFGNFGYKNKFNKFRKHSPTVWRVFSHPSQQLSVFVKWMCLRTCTTIFITQILHIWLTKTQQNQNGGFSWRYD